MEDERLEQNESTEAEEPKVDDARKKFIEEWSERIKESRDHWKTLGVYDEMKTNQEFAKRGADSDWIKGGNYTVPILNRHINQAVSQLYAKNPTALVKRREKMLYKLWDGRADTLQAALAGVGIGDGESIAIVQEVLAVRQYELQMDRMSKTMQILWDYYVGEQACNFKQQLKAAVRRAKVCKVGYVKLGYQRILEKRPEITAQIEDVTTKIAAVERILQDIAEGKIDDQSAELERLRVNLAELQEQETLLVREGLIFDFPRANEITIDKNCVHLKSLAGAGWVSHDFHMTPRKIKETWGVDIKDAYTKYKPDGSQYDDNCKNPTAYVHEVHDKEDRHCFVIVDGYHDYVKEPYSQLKIERFFPIFPIVFNETEDEKNIYPPSDIELAKDIQNEYNRSRESLREHRRAARPWWVEGQGLEREEKEKIANHEAHEVVTVKTLGTGQKITDLIQAGPTASIDPNLYEVNMHYEDLQRVLGTSAARFGGTSGDTATEVSVAEESYADTNSDNVDDLDEVLTELAKAAGQVMLTEVAKETVIEIVGEGAVWPDMPQTREQVAKDLSLDIKAGSSGRPNAAAELAKLERGAPILIQLQGINPEVLGRRYAELIDMDPDELVAGGMPSIQAMNALMAKAGAQPATGDPATDPASQGGEGADNAPGPQQNEGEPGGQPAYPAPAPPVA
ncbi:hypothetical protein [Methyloceanibacter caenitepidi]|uniref:Phage protein n=1 Tax=Methyloceanibacter caenitepidi TaxID=1384459 RepID=A0A0A8JZ64_9HYPH|nr:hypothetical protein [Methyloceanibacter caenitepidi]BAQ16098.1 hypothetical protein GL4_0635 [Methyloceanibacter caenitepidi]